MKKETEMRSNEQDIRREAEARLKESGLETFMPLHGEDMQRLLHELQVHHVELEMQNEQLLGVGMQRMLHELQVHHIELEMQNEQLLQSQEQTKAYMTELLTIYEHAPLIMVLLNSGRRVCKANNFTAEFAQINSEKIIGMSFGDALRCLHAQDNPRGCGLGPFCTECPIRKNVIYAIDSGLIHHQVEVNFISTFGEETKESVFLLSCVRLELHSEPMVLVSLLDITARKIAEEEREQLMSQLRQAEKMSAIGQLAGGIAHNFNNQLTGIIGFNEILADNLKDEELLSYTEAISTSAFRAAELTAQLMNFSRKRKCLAIPVNMHKLISEAVALLTNSIDKKITIKQHLAAAEYTIMGDNSRLENILINLGLNARDAMPSGGEIVFTTKESELVGEQAAILGVAPGRYLCIEVSDTGTGMSKDTLTHLFEPFFTTKDVGKGTGLGLASVYGGILSHHGGIDVQSRQGQGTSFYIYLSLADSDVALPTSTVEAICTVGGSGHVLLIDNEEEIVEICRKMLYSLGYMVTAYLGVKEAVSFYDECSNKIDLIILNISMPGVEGKGIFSAIRKVNPEAKILISSGCSIDSEGQELLDEGALAFIQKPFNLSRLSLMVSEILQCSPLKMLSEIKKQCLEYGDCYDQT